MSAAESNARSGTRPANSCCMSFAPTCYQAWPSMSIRGGAGTLLATETRMRTLRSLLLVGGAIALLVLVYRLGADSIASALTHVSWWQFILVCQLQGLNVVVDAFAWRYALTGGGAPFWKLVAARLAGDAANVLTALAS